MTPLWMVAARGGWRNTSPPRSGRPPIAMVKISAVAKSLFRWLGQSQRDCALQPRVARHEHVAPRDFSQNLHFYPGLRIQRNTNNLNEVVPLFGNDCGETP